MEAMTVSVKLLETYYGSDGAMSIYAATNIPIDDVPWKNIDRLIEKHQPKWSDQKLVVGLRFHIDLTSEKQNTKIVCFEK